MGYCSFSQRESTKLVQVMFKMMIDFKIKNRMKEAAPFGILRVWRMTVTRYMYMYAWRIQVQVELKRLRLRLFLGLGCSFARSFVQSRDIIYLAWKCLHESILEFRFWWFLARGLDCSFCLATTNHSLLRRRSILDSSKNKQTNTSSTH